MAENLKPSQITEIITTIGDDDIIVISKKNGTYSDAIIKGSAFKSWLNSFVFRHKSSQSCDGSVGQAISYSSSLTSAGRPIIDDYQGIGIEVTSFNDNGFTITSLSAGNFGYITFVEV